MSILKLKSIAILLAMMANSAQSAVTDTQSLNDQLNRTLGLNLNLITSSEAFVVIPKVLPEGDWTYKKIESLTSEQVSCIQSATASLAKAIQELGGIQSVKEQLSGYNTIRLSFVDSRENKKSQSGARFYVAELQSAPMQYEPRIEVSMGPDSSCAVVSAEEISDKLKVSIQKRAFTSNRESQQINKVCSSLESCLKAKQLIEAKINFLIVEKKYRK